MSADRPVTTDALQVLGTIIGPDVGRDAIHLAVEPVVAAERLRPGEHITLGRDGRAYLARRDLAHMQPVGIVDPFLERDVQTDERFLLVVYPRQITSLRHVWEHPSFPPSEPVGLPQTSIDGRTQALSEGWLRRYVEGLGDNYEIYSDEPISLFDAIIQAALTNPASPCLPFDIDFDREIPDEFWLHLSIYSGQTIAAVRGVYFRCAC